MVLFQSPLLFLDGFVLQGCCLLLVALGALGDSPLLLTTVDFLPVGSFCFSFAVFLSPFTGVRNAEPGPQMYKNTATFYALCEQ